MLELLFNFSYYTYYMFLHELCADLENFIRGGSNFENVFYLVDDGREDQNTAINGPLSARKRNAI